MPIYQTIQFKQWGIIKTNWENTLSIIFLLVFIKIISVAMDISQRFRFVLFQSEIFWRVNI